MTGDLGKRYTHLTVGGILSLRLESKFQVRNQTEGILLENWIEKVTERQDQTGLI